MFGNAGAPPPTDAGGPPGGSVSAADGRDPLSEALSAVPPGPVSPAGSSISSANDETVGYWLEHLPERSWDLGPGE